MAAHKLLLLPGDGIGPEVMGEVKRLIDWLNKEGLAQFETEQGLVGGSAYDTHKVSISEGDTRDALDLIGVVDLGIDGALLAVAEIGDGLRLAEIDAAGEFAQDDDVEPLDRLALEA